eukprot:COSAG01_NODE_1573_length_9865_cov_132.568503_8_plen_93_part_00
MVEVSEPLSVGRSWDRQNVENVGGSQPVLIILPTPLDAVGRPPTMRPRSLLPTSGAAPFRLGAGRLWRVLLSREGGAELERARAAAVLSRRA